jgi:hypothetical protein
LCFKPAENVGVILQKANTMERIMKPTLGILLTLLFVGGCAGISGIPERSANVKTELQSLSSYFSSTVITTYNAKLNDASKKEYRDEVITARIRAIDLNYNEFVKNISEEAKKLNIGSDSAVLILGAAGAVSTITSTQAILAATSATVTGVKSSIGKNAFFDSTLLALVSQMQANRKQVLVNLYIGLELGVKNYSLMRALIDIEDYFQAGTIIGAVSEINKASGVKKSEAEAELSNIIKGTYQKDKAGDAIRLFWKPDGKTIDASNLGRLKVWMKANGIDNTSITLFMRAQHFEDARAKAVKEIPIQ